MENEIKDYGLVFEPTAPDHWQMGEGKATERFGAGLLNPSGQWEKYAPKPERQNNGLETQACTIYHSLNAWETLAKFYGYNDFPSDCAERFNAILAEVTPSGNSPHKSCEAIRKFGVIPNAVLPFSENIHDWVEYYSPTPMTEDYIALGQQILRKYELGHEYIFNGSVGFKNKADMLVEALQRGTVCVSVRAWKEKNGIYYKEPDEQDTHWVHITSYKQGKYFKALDSYPPFDKKIAWDTNFQTAKLYFMKPNTTGHTPQEKETVIDLLIRIIRELTKKLGVWTNLLPK